MLEQIQTQLQTLQFTRQKQIAFLEDILLLLKDGVSLNAAIQGVAEIGEGIQPKVATQIAHALATGQQMADGMQQWFAPSIVELIRVGEASHQLESALTAAITELKRTKQALSTVVNAMLYPIVVVVAALAVMVFVTNSVLSHFAEMRAVIFWPLLGQWLLSIGLFIQTWWWLMLMLAIGLIISLWLILQKSTSEFRQVLDTLPVLSLYRATVAARFMQSLGLLIENGIVLKKALSILQMDAQPYLAWHLLMMEYRLSGGVENIADVLDTQLLDRTELTRLRIVSRGEKGFQRALLSLGEQMSERTMKRIAITGRIWGTALLIIAAGLAAMTIYSIYMIGGVVAN